MGEEEKNLLWSLIGNESLDNEAAGEKGQEKDEVDVASTRDPLESLPSVLIPFANCCNGLPGYSPASQKALKELRYPPEDWDGPLPHLIVLVSRSSGGGVGKKVLRKLTEPTTWMNELTVISLQDMVPEAVKATLRDELVVQTGRNGVRVVAAGGDGTVSWVASMVADICDTEKLPLPPIAAMPLGTGNELARNTGWSNTHTGKKLIKFLMHVATRRIFHLDTWTITCQPAEQGAACSEQQIVCFASAGFDASIAWRFHHMRENSPSESGNSVVANKAWHVWYGIDELVFPKTYVRDCLKVWVDGEEVVVPPDVNTVQVMSVPTGSDGTDYFKPGEKSQPGEMQEFSPPCMGDGLLEIMGTGGVADLLAIRGGLRHATRIAQGSHVQIFTCGAVPFQQEGEPRIQQPATITVSRKGSQPVVVGPMRTFCVPPEGTPPAPIRATKRPPPPRQLPNTPPPKELPAPDAAYDTNVQSTNT